MNLFLWPRQTTIIRQQFLISDSTTATTETSANLNFKKKSTQPGCTSKECVKVEEEEEEMMWQEGKLEEVELEEEEGRGLRERSRGIEGGSRNRSVAARESRDGDVEGRGRRSGAEREGRDRDEAGGGAEAVLR